MGRRPALTEKPNGLGPVAIVYLLGLLPEVTPVLRTLAKAKAKKVEGAVTGPANWGTQHATALKPGCVPPAPYPAPSPERLANRFTPYRFRYFAKKARLRGQAMSELALS